MSILENLNNLITEETLDEAHPVLQFQYSYGYPFTTVAAGFLQKYNYESRTSLTSTTGVEQLDDDRFVLYRRVETVFTDQLNYERVIYDRRNGGTITSELIRPRPGGERVFERGVIESQEEGAKALHNHFIYDHQGIKTWKVDFFKNGVERLIKAIKFAEYEKQAE